MTASLDTKGGRGDINVVNHISKTQCTTRCRHRCNYIKYFIKEHILKHVKGAISWKGTQKGHIGACFLVFNIFLPSFFPICTDRPKVMAVYSLC